MRKPSLAALTLAALVAGLLLGAFVGHQSSPLLRAIPAYAEPIGTLWMNALRMLVIPLVTSAVLVGIDSVPDTKSVGRLGSRTIAMFLVILVLAAAFAAFVGPILLSRFDLDSTTTAALRQSVEAGSRNAPPMSLAQWFVDLVPANPIKAFADGAMLQVLTFTILLGLALSAIETETRRQFMAVVQAIYRASLVAVQWVLAAMPVGVFALAVALSAKIGFAAVQAAGFYVAAVSAMTAAFAVLFYISAAFLGGRSVRDFARACLPAQAVALSSRSSLASLPALLEGAEQGLALPASVRSFVLPLAVAMFRPAGAITIAMAVVFIAKLYGVHLGAVQLAGLTIGAAVTTLCAPGIPNGSILVMMPVLQSLGLPVGAVSLILGVDTIPDIIRTVVNVTGDMSVATVLSRVEKGRELELPNIRTRAVVPSEAREFL